LSEFLQILGTATSRIEHEYFQLPVADKESAIYRERCYCYELYHQIRSLWEGGFEKISGEVDKSGHPIIRGNGLDKTKPDFIIHVPESMDENTAVIEVKPITARLGGIKKDINTLVSYLSYAGYKHAIYLFYGPSSHGRGVDKAISYLEKLEETRVQIWHHESVGGQAIRVF